jgi:rsbT antagonist protein RsbS
VQHIPILRIGDLLLVSIQIDIQDTHALALQDDLTTTITKTGAKGVLIDISAVEVVDSFIARAIRDLSEMARVLDATTVVVGMRPAVAITLVELGVSMKGVKTALNIERGMALLQSAGARELRDDAAP